MVLFTYNVKKTKGAAHKNVDVYGTCKRALTDHTLNKSDLSREVVDRTIHFMQPTC